MSKSLYTAAELFNWFEQCGKVLSIWCFARQVHLPKHVPRPDGRCDASKLRPITLLSSWYRLWGSARLQSQCVQAWLPLWWPSEAVGGKKGCDVMVALEPIASNVDHSYIGSPDFSLAFKSIDPPLAVQLLVHAGLPGEVARML